MGIDAIHRKGMGVPVTIVAWSDTWTLEMVPGGGVNEAQFIIQSRTRPQVLLPLSSKSPATAYFSCLIGTIVPPLTSIV